MNIETNETTTPSEASDTEATRAAAIADKAKAKAKARVAKEAKAKAKAKPAQVEAKATGNHPFSGQAFELTIGGTTYRYPAGWGMGWVEKVCKGKRLKLVPGAKVEWPNHKSVLGKPSEAQIRKGPKSGLPFAEYAESWPCLGFMIRKGWVLPTKA